MKAFEFVIEGKVGNLSKLSCLLLWVTVPVLYHVLDKLISNNSFHYRQIESCSLVLMTATGWWGCSAGREPTWVQYLLCPPGTGTTVQSGIV